MLGAERALSPTTWRMTGPLAFASSDISARDVGYLNGAIVSGLRAAEELGRFLGRDQRRTSGGNNSTLPAR